MTSRPKMAIASVRRPTASSAISLLEDVQKIGLEGYIVGATYAKLAYLNRFSNILSYELPFRLMSW